MTDTQEFSGKDINIAIKNACAKLMLSKEELEYDVICEGTSGILGIVGRKEARIRVILPEVNNQDFADMEGIKSIVDEAFGEETRVEPQRKKAVRKIDSVVKERTEPVEVTQASIDLGVKTLKKMADLITDDASVVAETNQNRLTLKAEGGNAGILIGRKGQTLDAMQFLTDKIINRKSDARVRVQVDIEGYMETRKKNLRHLAYKMADKAKKTGHPAKMNQMSVQDRRIVHLALKNDNEVRTQSMGDGYYRTLVIFPLKKNFFRRKRRFRR